MSNVLLIGMNFYKYEQAIIETLERNGYKVSYFIDKKDFFIDHFHHFISIGYAQKVKMISAYQNKALEKITKNNYDYVVVLVGRYLQVAFLEKLRKANPKAEFILYLWDDIKRVENFEKAKNYYDRIISFDPEDASNYGFEFLPLFFEQKNCVQKEKQLDIFSAMYLHSDRERIVYKLMHNCPSYKYKIILKCDLLTSIKTPIHSIREGTGKVLYRRRSTSDKEVIKEMIRTRAVLDIQFPSQIGLTMRTFDSVSVGTKLITTNQSIQYYDFYNPSNICIIDRDYPIVSEQFLYSYYKEPEKNIVDKYSLDNWISVLFGLKEEKYLTDGNPYFR